MATRDSGKMKAASKKNHLKHARRYVSEYLKHLHDSHNEAEIRKAGAARQVGKYRTAIRKAEEIMALLNPPAADSDNSDDDNAEDSNSDQDSSDDDSPDAGTMMAKKDKTYDPARHA